ADYDIISDDNVNVNVPYQSLEYTPDGIVPGIPGILVEAAKASASINDPGLTESNLEGAELTLTLSEERFRNSTLLESNFTHNGPSVISVKDVIYVDNRHATIILGLNGDLASDVNDFRITVAAIELDGTRSLTTNGISIAAGKNPEIKNVTIPDGTYKILDKVNVVITVADDEGKIYTYKSGTVAGNPLEGIERISATEYQGYFTVQEGDQSYRPGESIPVTNLQLADGSNLSNLYSGTITESITIDAKRPVINYMQAPTGVKKVGDLVDIIVSADGALYKAVESQTKVNNVPLSASNVSFIELGNGVYILRYQVAEGDADVSSGNLTASLQVMDPAGNLSLIKTSLTSNTMSIDANSPKVTRITVPNGVFNIGDVIEVLIQADGSNYTATNDTYVNGISLSSSSVTFGYVSGNQYRLLYTVNKVDPEVLPGEINIVVYLRDPSGNTGQPYSTVEPNTLAIYTNLPSAVLTGNQSICEGDPAKLTVSLTGRSPWKIYLFDGSETKEYTGINSSPYEIFVTPSIPTNYRIDSVVDVNGTPNTGTGIAQVTVRERTAVEIINLNSTYSVEADPIQLEASIEGGTFSGPGVNSAAGTFDPGVADTVNSPHTLYYTYINENNCPSVDSALVFVLGAAGDLFIPKKIYCNYDDPFTVTATNMSEDTGSFVLVDESGNEADGLTDNGDNTATVDPGALTPGNYIVEYEYFDEIIFILKESFRVESVEQPEILIPDQEEYCQNVVPFKMESSVPEAVFTGPGVTGNVSNGFVFDPRAANIGSNTIILAHTSPGGCSRADTITITIAQIPDVNFISETLCVGPSDTVFFTNTTTDKDLIEEWSWDFGDPRSGDRNFSSEESPWHLYNDAGARTITLIGTAESGCSDTLRKTLDFGNTPSGSFRWDNECFDEGATVTFTSEMTSVSPIISYEWTITDPEGEIVTTTREESFVRSFEVMDSYTVELHTESEAGCQGYSKRELVLKPIIT
ncbi:MAG: hypothetical protein IH594_12095, partial [Bacteroidales bacterium]|nr:hypothetical protein [Bacteroidales bacterium]